MPTFRGLQGFCPLGPHLTRLRVQLFSSSFSQNSLPLSCFFSSLPSLRAVRRILPPCLWLLHICVSSMSVLPCTLTVCPFVCLLYKPCFSSPPFTRIQFFFKSCFFFFHSLLVSLLPLCPYPTTPALVPVLGLWPLKSMIQVLWQVSEKPCASSFPPHRFYSVHDSLVGGQPIASPALLAPSPYYGEFRKYSCPSSQDDLDLGPLC